MMKTKPSSGLKPFVTHPLTLDPPLSNSDIAFIGEILDDFFIMSDGWSSMMWHAYIYASYVDESL